MRGFSGLRRFRFTSGISPTFQSPCLLESSHSKLPSMWTRTKLMSSFASLIPAIHVFGSDLILRSRMWERITERIGVSQNPNSEMCASPAHQICLGGDASFCQNLNTLVVPVTFLLVCRPHAMILRLGRLVAAFFTGHGFQRGIEAILLRTLGVLTNA